VSAASSAVHEALGALAAGAPQPELAREARSGMVHVAAEVDVRGAPGEAAREEVLGLLHTFTVFLSSALDPVRDRPPE
jgi:hypothetical protein